ncbi:MAG: hypothetical protein U1D31_02470 [Patescibacteria group bacterium]|nr:hypothetical protein [bacterium]MDZ4240962.1 hypothetical protein [Patescibacteria group bacterium]
MESKTIEKTVSPFVVAFENPHQAKRKLRIAWHLEEPAREFVWSQRSFLSSRLFLLACGLRKIPDGFMKEARREVCLFDKGMTYLHLPVLGAYTIRVFIVWPEGESNWWIERNFVKRLTFIDSYTKHYNCGVLGYLGEIDRFHLLASEKDGAGHWLHKMRESVMGPDYYLYDLNASIEVNVEM